MFATGAAMPPPEASLHATGYLGTVMGSEFLVYLRLGFEHIADVRGYDHIVFIVALTAMYPPREWVRVVVLVTAFTVGHTVTLALATFELIRVATAWVEFLIPVTILATAVLNAAELEWRDVEGTEPSAFEPAGGRRAKYGLALVFGLIHGLGFSNFLRAALGAESAITVPLLAFNVGVEVGQIAIVLAVMAASWVMTVGVGLRRRAWTLVLSGAVGVVAAGMVVGRWPL